MFMKQTTAHAKSVAKLYNFVHTNWRVSPVTDYMEQQIEKAVENGSFSAECAIERVFPSMKANSVALAFEKVPEYFRTMDYTVSAMVDDGYGSHSIKVSW